MPASRPACRRAWSTTCPTTSGSTPARCARSCRWPACASGAWSTPGVTSADLCFEAAERLLERLGWERDSISGAHLRHAVAGLLAAVHELRGPAVARPERRMRGLRRRPRLLRLSVRPVHRRGDAARRRAPRILMLHGETPSRFVSPEDHATTLLFGDAGSATALEAVGRRHRALLPAHRRQRATPA